MRLSVIIPVYNVEKYLAKCLNSVICQDFEDMEIICINDGSTDNSFQILKSYAQHDPRFVIIDKQNEGVSAARNVGIDRAKGDYILFLDGDDCLTYDAATTAYINITESNADIGIFGYNEQYGDIKTKSPQSKLITKYVNNPASVDYTALQVVIWNKIYKKSFLNDNNIRFVKGIKNAEDVIFNFDCYFSKPIYCLIDKILYNYLINRENSATSNSSECVQNDFDALKLICQNEKFNQQPLELKLNIANRFCKGAVYYWDKFYSVKARKILLKSIKAQIEFLENNYQNEDLRALPYYRKLKNLYLYTFINWCFSIKNIGCEKIITILGIRIKLKHS